MALTCRKSFTPAKFAIQDYSFTIEARAQCVIYEFFAVTRISLPIQIFVSRARVVALEIMNSLKSSLSRNQIILTADDYSQRNVCSWTDFFTGRSRAERGDRLEHCHPRRRLRLCYRLLAFHLRKYGEQNIWRSCEQANVKVV